MLIIQQLNKSFGAHQVIQQLDLSIDTGALTAIIGPNGCGKSTLFNLITGQLAADSGNIYFTQAAKQHHLNGLKPRKIAQLGILRKFQIPGIYANMTVLEHLQLAFIIQKKSIQPNLIQQTAKRMGLAEQLSTQAGVLPTGQKQWLEMAMLVLLQPTLLLLDEPIAGMTAAESEQTRDILLQLNAEGLTIITIEHNIDFVKALTKDIAVIMDGNVMMRSDYASIAANKKVRKDYLGSLYA